MALILTNKSFNNGLTLENVYCKVTDVSCNKEKITFNVGIYVNKETKEKGSVTLENKNYSCTHDVSETSRNSIKQAYDYLKTLEEYKNAIDDLDS